MIVFPFWVHEVGLHVKINTTSDDFLQQVANIELLRINGLVDNRHQIEFAYLVEHKQQDMQITGCGLVIVNNRVDGEGDQNSIDE